MTYPVTRQFFYKGGLDKLVNEASSLRGKVIRCRVVFQVKFCPDYQMHDPGVKSIRPVIVQNLIAVCRQSAVNEHDTSSNVDILGSLNDMSGLMNPSCQPSRSWRTNAMTEPYSFLSWALYSIYLRKSEGTRWRRSILLSSCMIRGGSSTQDKSRTYDLLDFSPCQSMVLGVWSSKDASVLCICAHKELWTLLRPICSRHVHKPIRQWFHLG